MKTKGSISLAALCATAAIFAIPTGASAASLGTLSVKAPACSKSSTATVTLTAKPSAGMKVGLLGAANAMINTPGVKPYFVKSYQTYVPRRGSFAFASETVVLSGKVPVGKKIYAIAGMVSSGQVSGGFVTKTFTVKKCATFTG